MPSTFPPAMFRRFLLSSLLSLAGFSQAASQPNILFIFCDDLTTQAISTYGDKRKLLQTPGMDRLAKEGIRFDRCLVTNSICGPMRAVIQTGKYSHLNGFYNNSNSTFDSTQQTFPKLLQKGGYTNAVIGKWHLMTDPVGYDYWHVLPGQGAYYNPPMIDNGKPVKHSGYTTDIITDLSLEWLKNRDKTKPFMLMMQHKAPHREWEPPIRHLGHDNDRVYEEPETLFDTFEGRTKAVSDHDMGIERTMTDGDLKLKPPGGLTEDQLKYWNEYYEPRNAKYHAANLTGKEHVKWRYQRYMHDYTACVKAVDDSVQRTLDYLDKEGLAENTIVILSSDQGFYLGEHGWFDKRWIFEESLRTPLLVRWPGVTKPGSVSRDIVSNVDFAETFLEIAGVQAPAEMQGHSLVPLFRGQRPPDWRTSFYYQYFEWPTPHRVRPHYGVVTDRYKLVRYFGTADDYWELFDREKDPLELKSYYNDPAYTATKVQLEQELNRLRKELQVPEQIPARWIGNPPGSGKKKKAN